MISVNENYLLNSYLLNDLDPKEKEYIQKVLDQNPGLEKQLNTALQNWEKSETINKIQQIDIQKELSIFNELKGKLPHQEQIKEPKIRPFNYKLLAAASIFLMISISSFFYFFSPFKTTPVTYTSFFIPGGQRGLVTLPDGTKVWLNSKSQLSYSNTFSQNSRDVILEGEAFFEVAHHKTPFHVNTKQITIEVMGTVFNVSSYPNDPIVETALLSGSIKLTAKKTSKEIILKPNEKAEYNIETGALSINLFKNDIFSSWKDGELAFFNEPAEEVIKKLERFFDKQFVFTEQSIRGKRFTAKFRKGESFEKILHVTGEALDLQFSSEKNIIYVKKK